MDRSGSSSTIGDSSKLLSEKMRNWVCQVALTYYVSFSTLSMRKDVEIVQTTHNEPDEKKESWKKIIELKVR